MIGSICLNLLAFAATASIGIFVVALRERWIATYELVHRPVGAKAALVFSHQSPATGQFGSKQPRLSF